MYLKNGYTITSRGCPNRCWFCQAWRREGNIRELKIKDGYNILDNNLLACSDAHIANVFSMLKRQKEKPKFTGGFEASRMRPWIADLLREVKPSSAYFAYDTPDDYDPLVSAVDLLKKHGAFYQSERIYSCYVLIGYRGDTFDQAEKRLNQVMSLGLMPMAMRYQIGKQQNNDYWKGFVREWTNKYIVGVKYSKYWKRGKDIYNTIDRKKLF